jgi:ketosteroid isomerase-like protein
MRVTGFEKMHKISMSLVLICSLAQPLLPQIRVTEPDIRLPAEFQRVLQDYKAAWQKHDAHALAQLFARDGYVLAPGEAPVKGREAIKRAYANAGGPLSLRAIAFDSEGKLAYILGSFTRRKGEADLGKFTLILRKDTHGSWLIVSDMDNSIRQLPR